MPNQNATAGSLKDLETTNLEAVWQVGFRYSTDILASAVEG